MIGSFTASPSALSSYSPFKGKGPLSAMITAVSGKPYIRFTASIPQRVTVRILDFSGRTQGPILLQMLTAGTNVIPLDAQIRSAGSYFIDVRYGTDEKIKAFRFVQ
jgi:hypothetical protein